jgi:hypothetical protein
MLGVVRHVIGTYRDGRTIESPDTWALLAVSLRHFRIRDDAWTRMDPAHCRLWTDLTRHAQPGYVPAAASLLAFTAWQLGEGGIALIATERALEDDPHYTMAKLIQDALNAGLPPSAAVLPMTPDEVTQSFHQRSDEDEADTA